ncbi:MAG: NAD(P)/FAD-dependent oxidoreductase [Deltaproteobacteria bacterium]|nr:NAD(P)/FAD-dependent oxidoreductase [Deltaproteobacteria bacterium]
MKIVIIGAGPAGITAAETLRRCDRKAEIVMLSAEPFPPYAPPAMIAYFLSGREIHFWKGRDIAERLGLDYRSGIRVREVLPDRRILRLDSGETLDYDRLVVATGSSLYAPVAGMDAAGVCNFKSLSAAEALIRRVRQERAKNALIVGAGFIGVEIALLLRDLGVEVTQVEMEDRVMPRMLDRETARIVADRMRERGVRVRLDTEARAVLGEGHAEAVELEGGETLTFDILIAATGVRPNIEFLRGSGIHTDWGVVVDEYLRTSDPNIYAVGDVAETVDRVSGERYVHAIFPNAVAQGRLAAQNISGLEIPYEGADNMNSLKHLGLPVIAAGLMEGEELRAMRDGALRKVYLQDERIVGFRLAGDLGSAGIYRTLMNRKINTRAFKHRLLDPGFGMGMIQGMARTPGWIQAASGRTFGL